MARLTVLADEQGATIRELLKGLVFATPTQDELHQRQAEAMEAMTYVAERMSTGSVVVNPGFGVVDVDAGERIRMALAARMARGRHSPK